MDHHCDQRKRALSARRALGNTFRQHASIRACRRLAKLPALRRARRIGIYNPLASEIDPRPLIKLLQQPSLQFHYPRVEGDHLRFVPTNTSTRWKQAGLGVLEPVGSSRAVTVLDVLILPLASFDHCGHRIGLGGGYYDRTLAPVRCNDYRGPVRIGFAFECQRATRIEPEPWDVELSAVVTEARLYYRHTSLMQS